MTNGVIDLRSDTLSLPTDEMLQSIQTARLGDDSRDGDPTVLELEALSARMLGKEAAMLTVSGTMSNVIAMRTSAEPGATAIVEQSAHLYGMEFGGIAAACGLLVLPVAGVRGAMDLDALRFAIRRAGAGFLGPGVLCLEDTHNAAGGAVIPPEHLDACAKIGHDAGLSVHLDGARVFNAAVSAGRDVRDFTRSADSVSFCLSKGLSAPVGSLVVGTGRFIDRARKVRRALGGTMRQAGIIAAPGLVALHSLIDRLAEDHANAAWFANTIAKIEGLGIDLATVQSNIVNVDVAGLGLTAALFAKELEALGVRGLPGPGTIVRFVTYRGITRGDVERAAAAVRTLAVTRPWAVHAS